jgi:hypothetical protein
MSQYTEFRPKWHSASRCRYDAPRWPCTGRSAPHSGPLHKIADTPRVGIHLFCLPYFSNT